LWEGIKPILTGSEKMAKSWKKEKAILKYAAGALEKLAVGSALVGLYQSNALGLWIASICFLVGCLFSSLVEEE